jgi:ABC-type sugar transport system ATPase subunit
MNDERALRAEHVTHRYGGALALRDVSFEVRPGEIHALVGENGAGKSTLVKVLTGALTPSEGELRIDGVLRHLGSPRIAQALGVGVVHQDYNLFPHLSVAMNICGVGVDTGGRTPFLTNPRRVRRAAREFLDEFGIDVDPDLPAGELEAAERKIVEICRALIHRPRYLLLDEPTAALEPQETRRLLDVMTSLRERGTGIILVTHRLGEIAEVADRATALRDGANVGSLTRDELTPAALTRLMVGADVEQLDGPQHPARGERLAVRGVRLRPDARPVDLTVREAEIVAVVGLIGSGCGDLLGMVTGARPVKHGTLEMDGRPVRVSSPGAAARLGIGYAPEDRKRLGLVMGRSIRENMALTSLPRWTRAGFVRRRSLERAVEENRGRFDIRCRDFGQLVETLSGGNQQKVLLARLQLAQSRLIVLHEPSQGVDIAARRAIHEYIVDYAASGGSVLFSSTDIDEVRAVAHRIYVMHAGEITAEFDNVGPDRPDRSALTHAISVDPRLEILAR